MSTATSTTTYTRTHTATYLADVITGAIGDILGLLGIRAGSSQRWDQDERAIAAWIEEQSLDTVILECHRPDGTVRPIFEFPVTYNASGMGRFADSRAAFARAQAKISSVPSGTTHQLVCTFRWTPSDQPGWSDGARASTDGLISFSFGSLADAPHASASLRYLR